ncbi:MAG: helix-turn-helix domain-containing protein [Candidatus Gracilibacteria bacterium]|nr:helix-turn-helix domain-containing protein [Candidatus Gracilibacteria bacterium]
MNNIQRILEETGLTHHESQVYLHLLAHGEQAASIVGKATHIPRSTVRGVLDSLCEQGIIRKLYKRNTQYYSCKNPELIITSLSKQVKGLEKHIKNVQQVIPLLSLMHSNRSSVPKVQFFEGVDQVIEAFNSTLFVEGIKEIKCITSYDFLKDPEVLKNDNEYYIPLRIKKKINLKVLMGAVPKNIRRQLTNEPHELRERRFLPPQYEFPGSFYLSGNTVLYFSSNDGEYIAVMVQSELMANTLKTLFSFMWSVASKDPKCT